MATKDVIRMREMLDANPLHYTDHPDKPVMCAECLSMGDNMGIRKLKKVTRYHCANFGNEFNHCYHCGVKYIN